MAAVGIDLGTTNSVIAAVNAAGKAVALRGAGEETSIVPSVVWFDDDGGRIVVGNEAKHQQTLEGGASVASFFKRQMGDRHARYVTNGREYTPVQLSAEVLKRLKRDGESALGQPVKDAVITVPAYFYNPEREATQQAAELAGLNALQLINEPTAAAVAFGVNAGAGQSGNVLVYDLGGGTFDVTLLRLDGKDIRVVTSEGDAQLGGKDWDGRIVNFLADRFREQTATDIFADRTSTGDLWTSAEKAKKALTTRLSTRVKLTCSGEVLEYDLTRDFFESLTADLTGRTIDLMNAVLGRGKIRPNQLDLVLLVGGSTWMPMVRTALEKLTGRKPSTGVDADEAVALGAALCAAGHKSKPQPTYSLGSGKKQADHTFTLPSGKSVTDVTPHSLGMIATTPDQSAYVNDFIMNKDQAIPRIDSKPYTFRTRANGANRLEIFLTQGEDSSPGNVKYLGCYAIPNVPHDPSGTATVDVVYSFNQGAIIDVIASLKSGQPLEVRVEPVPDDVPARFLLPPPKPPAPEPVTIYLTFDLSGSMVGDPLADAKRSAIDSFVDELESDDVSFGVIAHADVVKLVLSATNRSERVRKAINSLECGDVGVTNGQHPLDEAMKALRHVDGVRYVVALTDGIWLDQDQAIRSAKKLHREDVEVVAIGFGDADEEFLKEISSSDETAILTSHDRLGEAFSSIASVIGDR